ncbi:hypothetical protein GCM10029976_087520 [Kribbella albertanoniae]|uniref:AMP-dependent synthetase/ligase domain-containing protein n=1 Tax=Kribbella albertanoniae TaxID=1266829 RepID=A0A4R4QI22_9ACTN|nr:AMP-binding protein [Kribbella albertanoniae]TDC35294.1 hypothetical protein E1261_01825 [Kribbella albertanoniae]
MTLLDRLRLRCQDHLTAAAFAGPQREFTFGDLLEAATRAGDRLNELILRPGPIAAVVSEPAARVPAVLAVAAAGRPLVALDPEWPAGRRDEVVTLLGCAAVIADRSDADYSRSITLLDSRFLVDSCPRPAVPPVPDLQYVIFTSGSTGRPKGVAVSQPALEAHIDAVVDWLEIQAGDRVLQFARLAFDTSQEEIWPTLFAGATVVAADSATPTFAQLHRRLRSTGTTVLQLPTAYWRQWARYLDGRELDLETLRMVVIGGEAAYESDAFAWRSGALSTVRLVNSYGPTEAGITASAYEVPSYVANTQQALPIGQALRGRLFSLESTTEGDQELLIAGPTLAAGYLTENGLVQDGFVDRDDGRWYRTGDLVRWIDGSLAFAGRRDRQVKILGRRVELESIEAALLTAGATDARVEAATDHRGRTRLCALVVTDAGVEELRDRLSSLLPQALIPARIDPVDRLPRNAAGKVDLPAVRGLLPPDTVRRP